MPWVAPPASCPLSSACAAVTRLTAAWDLSTWPPPRLRTLRSWRGFRGGPARPGRARAASVCSARPRSRVWKEGAVLGSRRAQGGSGLKVALHRPTRGIHPTHAGLGTAEVGRSTLPGPTHIGLKRQAIAGFGFSDFARSSLARPMMPDVPLSRNVSSRVCVDRCG